MIFRWFAYAVVALSFSTVGIAAEPWLYTSRIGGTFIYNEMSDADLVSLIDQRASENVNVLELDSRLSYYLSDEEFDAEVEFLDKAAELANQRGLKAVVYYPTLEVLTKDGVTADSTMAKDHPDWLQRGIDGTPNVFYGGQEVWVSPGEESAWLSPNSGYLDYFIERVEKLAATDLDGVWLDVPVYLDTGVRWAGAEPAAAAAFAAWSVEQGLAGDGGYAVPASENFNDSVWRAWIKWRRVNLADFLRKVQQAAEVIDPEFAVIIENYPMDYMDGTLVGLDATAVAPAENLIHVWEADSVSNTQAMKWSGLDDFENKIAMLKWGKSVHGAQPSWSFSYGHEPLDAGLTMSAVVATDNAPFEAKTPSMLTTVDTDFRRNWFGYLRDHQQQLLAVERSAQVGIWYSSDTRDFQDYVLGGGYSMFSVTTPPAPDPDWWADRESHSVVSTPHLGGYRGMSAALIRMNIPYEVVIGHDDGPGGGFDDLDVLLLPSVGAISDADVAALEQYVSTGGVVIATGSLPGTMDEIGQSRAVSALDNLFDFNGSGDARVNRDGDGLAIYRPDIVGTRLFGEQLDQNLAAQTLTSLEQLVRIHANEPFTLEDGEGIYTDHAVVDDNQHLLYVVNYSGLQQPLVQSIKPVVIHYKAPAGKRIASVVASTPDIDGLNGFANIVDRGHGMFRIEVPVDQFALLEITFEDTLTPPAADYAGPQFEDPIHAEAARAGLDFILDKMRNSTLPEPNRFGVHTNYIDNFESTEIYTGGHNVTGEHMGLLLRTSACMNDQDAFNEAYRYASEVMYSPLYHLPNWSIDKNEQRPFLFYDDFRGNWLNANAPLDDLRLIHGLIDGYENFGDSASNELADSMLEGLYWTTVTDRNRDLSRQFPEYSGGLLGFAWDWSEVDDGTLDPPARASGLGWLGSGLIPVDYQDLGAIAHAAERDHRWRSVLQATTQLSLDSEINLSGLYYNGYRPDGTFTGDFEYQGTRRGEHLKVIQVLWTAIHLARVAKSDTDALSDTQKSLALGSAARSLAFFKEFYTSNNRIPEYLTFSGVDVDDCVGGQPADCLDRQGESLYSGEARIYAQVARLALLLGDKAFSTQLIDEQIIPDRIAEQTDPLYGMIGVSTAVTGDAEAWDHLESVFSICLNAVNDDDTGPPGGNNNPPQANTDALVTNEETPLVITATQLLGNDTDPDNDVLRVSGVPGRSANGGSVELLSTGDWQYTPPFGFSGGDTVSYAISDGRGGTAIGQITIDVLLIPKTSHLTDAVTILTGTLSYGSVEFLTTDDIDTYDISSAATAEGRVVDWYVSAQIDNPVEVIRFKAAYSGHYSVPGVTQETLLFNFTSNEWVSIDTRVVGDESDSIVQIDITENPQDYIAANGETRMRIKGTHPSLDAQVWANSASWIAYRQTATGNRAPVADGASISTTTNTPVNLLLTGSDADNDPISFALYAEGLMGTLSGTAPDLVYTPASGFNGIESFTYSVSDGQLTSNTGVVVINVLQSGIVSNLAAAITLDGDLGDWAGYIPFAEDPRDVADGIGDNPLDWRQAWMAHDGGNYYLAYRNDRPINASWGQTVYIDIDDNSATGLQNGLPIGADRLLQGRFLYAYAGNGSNWDWTFITEVVGTSDIGSFEYRFPRSALNNSELLKLVFVGSNEPYGGVIEDLYPDSVYNSSATDRSFTYTAVAPANSAPFASDLEVLTNQNQAVTTGLMASDGDGDALTYSMMSQPQHGTLSGTAPDLNYQPENDYIGDDSFSFQVSDGLASSRIATVSITVRGQDQSVIISNRVTQLTVDGNLAEWQLLRYFENDPNDTSDAQNPVDYLRAAMAHDSSNFYLTFSNATNAEVLQDWLFTVYIDTDQNPATGYRSGLAIGADYMQQGTNVYVYAGTGQDWTWTAQVGSLRAVNGSDVELSIPRQQIGDPAQLKMVLIGDNFSIGGSLEEVYPDGTYNPTAAVRFLEYQTGGTPSEPAVLAAFNDVDPVSGRQELMANAVELNRPQQEPDKARAGVIGIIGVGGGLLFVVLVLFRRSRPTASA